ncbi:MAG: YgjV family protein [Eubacteriales bacterium]|nr:YgjV family protein [Eubacteriales bacterium]
MNTMMIELVGYVGSILVVVSMLMTSVIRLRVVNSIGAGIFTVYAWIIQSYPTALMNFCLVVINIYHLARMYKDKRKQP